MSPSEGSSHTSLNTDEGSAGAEGSSGAQGVAGLTSIERKSRTAGEDAEGHGGGVGFEMGADTADAYDTYAQWLEDSTQVSAKQLVSQFVIMCAIMIIVSSSIGRIIC